MLLPAAIPVGQTPVVTFDAFCCPTVGARKPVLAEPRRLKRSFTRYRAPNLKSAVLSNSSKCSMRPIVASVRFSTTSASNST